LKTNERELIRSICQDSFIEFVKEFWSELIPEKPVWNWHIEFLCDEYQKMAERIFAGKPKEYDHVCNVSPGSSKSTIGSIMLPAWAFTRMKSFRFLGASYSYPLAMDLSRKTRDVITSDKYKEIFPDVILREDQNTKGYFGIEGGGQRYAVGINGSATGTHAHWIGIDDPLDPNQAFSPTDLASCNRWIKETLSTRKVDKVVSVMSLIMQRLNQDDPTALFLKRKRCRHICLPAMVTEDIKPAYLKKFYRKGVMDAARLPKSVLDDIERDLGSYAFSSQFRQTPTPPGGGMFQVKKLQTPMIGPDRFARVVRYWDKAATASKSAAFTVGVKMGLDYQGNYWIIDVVRGQWDSYTRERKMRETAELDGVGVEIGLEQEPGSGGKDSAQDSVKRLAGFRVKVFKVGKSDGSKEQRADPFSVQVNAGNVYLCPGDWHDDYKTELTYFPFSPKKDQVDASSGAFNVLAVRKKYAGALRSKYQVENSY
jgi:predicted phage terminase large subunit-like protein